MNRIAFNMLTLTCLWASQCLAQTWLPVGNGIGGCSYSNHVEDICVSNSKLLIAGTITNANDCDTMRAVVTWNGSHFYQTGEGDVINARSDLVFEYEGKVYAHGQYFISFDVSRLHTVTSEGIWDTVSHGVSGLLQDCYIHNGIAYISGALGYCGNVPCSFVCTFDGEQALPYYTGPSINYHIYSVNVYQDTVFAAGNYTAPSGLHTQGYSNCAKVVNGQLERVGQGFPNSGIIYDMEQYDGKLFLSGGSPANGITGLHSMYYYENGQLHTLPTEPNYTVYAMKAYNGGLYVAGRFTQISGVPCHGVARWNGEEWTCLNHEPIQYTWNSIKDIEIWNDTLYIGGGFHHFGETEINRIAKLDISLSEAFPVSVTEQQKEEMRLSVYPNPAKHELNITLPLGADTKDRIAIYDVHGRLIKEQLAGKFGGNMSVDVSGISAGMYVLKYQGKAMVLMEQFIKE